LADVPPIYEVQTRRRAFWEAMAVLCLSLALNLAGNGRVGLWDRDEPRYAVAVREMRERGDWITPSFNGEPRYHKPILIYWINGLGTYLAGDNPFGIRLGSALAGAGTCVLTWWLGRRLLSPTSGLIAALALATSPLMIVESKLGTTDATLAFFVVLAQLCLWELNNRPSILAASGFWTALALASLTKGPVGPALIAVSGLACWWFRGPSACWKRLRWGWGVTWWLALTVPWFAAIAISSRGDFYRFAVGVQMLQRVASPVEQHGGFPGFYVAGTLLSFYPWSALVPAAVLAAWTRRKTSPIFGFLLGWTIGPLVVLELFRTKLIHYYLPALPALALLVAWLVVTLGREAVNLRRLPLGRLAVGLLVGMAVLGTAGFVAFSLIGPAELHWPIWTMALVLAVGTAPAVRLFVKARPVAAARVLVICWATMTLILSAWLLPAAEPFRLSRVVGEKLASLARADRAAPILLTYQEPGIHYAMKLKAPTLRDWDEVQRLLLRQPTLVTAATSDQFESLSTDGRFLVDLLESLDGFNLSKGKAQSLRLARLRLSPLGLACRPVEQSQVK
jgi:4-amino-4-deoxy-L-arabinose transferase-like glycosyltransferase